jgi:hypothetical protein
MSGLTPRANTDVPPTSKINRDDDIKSTKTTAGRTPPRRQMEPKKFTNEEAARLAKRIYQKLGEAATAGHVPIDGNKVVAARNLMFSLLKGYFDPTFEEWPR